MKGDLWENQLFSVKKVLKSAKQRYSDRQRVCFSNHLVLVYIRTKFGDYSERLADFREGGSIRIYRTRISFSSNSLSRALLCSFVDFEYWHADWKILCWRNEVIKFNKLLWSPDGLIFAIQKQLPVFCKKGVLRNFANFTGKKLCQSLFFNSVGGLGSEKRDSGTGVFLWILWNFLQNISRRLLLTIRGHSLKNVFWKELLLKKYLWRS